jgi:hypothetical protein
MIEKKIYSDHPELNKPLNSDDGLSKSFGGPQEEPLKKDAPQEEVKQEEVVKQEQQNSPAQLPAEPDMRIAVFLIEAFGKEAFERLRSDGNFLVPFTDEASDLDTWLAQSIRMLFKPEETDTMGIALKRWIEQQREMLARVEKELEQEKLKAEVAVDAKKQAENDFVIADSERKQLRRDLLSSVSAVYFIDRFLPKGQTAEGDKIAGMLKEEMSSPTEDYPGFVTGFLEAWPAVLAALNAVTDDEAGMEAVHLSLTNMLEKIAEKNITRRRAILEIIAAMCSAKFKLYKFISPEESLQVDPRIHSATALGGSTIREGVTFAVVRKDTMQTVKYAEIKV